jgi:drug/metabolite transporter (DMT)-like permease
MSVSEQTPDLASDMEDEKKKNINTSTFIYLVLFVVIILDSFGSPIIRLTMDSGMPSLAITGLRMPIAWLILTPYVWRKHRHEIANWSSQDIKLIFWAGIIFSGHLILIFEAIDATSIMIVHVMFSTSILWVALLERIFLKAHLHKMVIAGVILAFVGGLIIGLADSGHGDAVETGDTITGALIALLAAAGGSVYLVIGRKVRENVSSIPYLWGIFTSGSLLSTAALLVTGTAVTGYSAESYFWLFVLLIMAQFLIHGSLNYLMGYLSATFTSIAFQVTTVTASMVAFFLFGEVPLWMEVFGGAVIISGVVVAILGRRDTNN